MKKIIIPVLLLCLLLTACTTYTPAVSQTEGTQPTTSTKPTTSSTVSTTVSTAPTTITAGPTTVSTTQLITSTKPTTNTTKQTTVSAKPTTNTTKPTTITTIPTSSTTQEADGLLYRGNRITVYREKENYIFDIIGGKEVEFSPDRVVVRAVLVEPIKCDNYQELLNCSLDDVKSVFGEPHFDEGSGFYIPSYITEDAHILSLYPNDDGIIEGVFLNDPTRNEPTKFWTIYDEQ